MHRLAGSSMTSLLISPEYAPFLHIFSDLQQVEIDTEAAMSVCDSSPFSDEHLAERVISGKSFTALTSLQSLRVTGSAMSWRYDIEHLEVLTQLKSLYICNVVPVLSSSSGSISLLPSLTSLTLLLDTDYDQCDGLLEPLLRCGGNLTHLVLGQALMEQCDNAPGFLCHLPCLHQLEHLELKMLSASPSNRHAEQLVQLRFSRLQILSVQFSTVSGGCDPQWDLSGCRQLRILAITSTLDHYHENRFYAEESSMNLMGLKGVHASILHVAHHRVGPIITDFSGWSLDAVKVYSRANDWRNSQSVRALLGALLDVVPMSKVINRSS